MEFEPLFLRQFPCIGLQQRGKVSVTQFQRMRQGKNSGTMIDKLPLFLKDPTVAQNTSQLNTEV